MSKNPYYCPTTYFMSGQYSDKIIANFLIETVQQNYSTAIHNQSALSTNKEWELHMSDFVVDKYINRKYELPYGTYVACIPEEVLPISNKRYFIGEYNKLYNEHISIIDTYTNHEIFKTSVACIIDGYRFMELILIPTNLKQTLAVILPNLIPTSNMTNMIARNAKISIYYENHSTVYHHNSRLSEVISNGNDGINSRITLPLTDRIAKVANKVDLTNTNSWDLYISARNTFGNNYLLAQSVSYLLDITSQNAIFNVNREFLNYITNSIYPLDIYVIHRPNRIECIHYLKDGGTDPIIRMGYENNPVHMRNVKVFDFNRITDRKTNKINNDTVNRFAFPDIYDFKSIMKDINEDMLIEVYEFPIESATFTFDNHCIDFMNSVGDDYEKIVGMEFFNAISDYDPIVPVFSSEEYLNSEYFEDIRGYMLSKLQELMDSDPYIFKKLTMFIDDINKRSITEYHTPDNIKLNEPSVYDTTFISEENVSVFATAQKYIKFKSETECSPSMLYFDGIYTIPTEEYSDKNDMYLFIDEIISNALPQNTECVAIDVFNRSTLMPVNVDRDNFSLGDMQEQYTIFRNGEVTNTALSDLIFYNSITGEIYTYDKFDFSVVVDEYVVKTPNAPDTTILEKEKEINYLLTSLREVIATADTEEIILAKSNVTIDGSVIDQIYPNGIYDICNKLMDMSDISVRIKDPALLGTDITVSTAGKSFVRYSVNINNVENDKLGTVTNVTGPIDPDKYELYVNGYLLDSSKYTVNMHTRVGGNVTIKFNDSYEINNRAIVYFIQTPIAYTKYDNITVSDLEISYANFFDNDYTGDLSLSWEGEYSLLDFTFIPEIINWNNARVFIDGKRISVGDMNHYKVMNMLSLPKTLTNSAKTISLRLPKRDADIYNMTKDCIQNILVYEIEA